jgi:hypothetical protein
VKTETGSIDSPLPKRGNRRLDGPDTRSHRPHRRPRRARHRQWRLRRNTLSQSQLDCVGCVVVHRQSRSRSTDWSGCLPGNVHRDVHKAHAGTRKPPVMDRRRFLRITATVTTPFVAGCIGDGGDGADGEAGNGRDENETTTGEVIAAGGGGTTADRRTTEAVSKPTRTTGKTGTTAPEHTETVSGGSTENPYRPPTPIGTPTRNGLAIVGIRPVERQ